MKNNLITRKRFTPTQRTSVVAACRRSRLTRKEFAAQAGVGLSTLHAWLRQSPSADRPARRMSFLEVPAVFSAGGPPAPYRLLGPGGWTLEVRHGLVAEELRQVCQILQGL